jgi:virulence-associated protein VagC
MDKDQGLYLRLSEDFGGTRFGPFEGVEVALGSGESNDIRIPESFGVAVDHAKVLLQEGRGILITPVAQTTSVYVWKGRATKPSQIATPTAVRHGDSFALVSAQGPRFSVEIDFLPEDVLAKRREFRGRENLTKDAMKKESRRQLILRIMTTGWGQRIGKAWWFVRSGEIFLPRNIFMIAAIGGGWVMGTMAMCSKADGEREVAEIQELLDDANAQTGDDKYYTLKSLYQKVTQLKNFESFFRKNPEFEGKVRKAAGNLYNSVGHAWISDATEVDVARQKRFMDTFDAIESWSVVDQNTRRLLPWANILDPSFSHGDDNSWWGRAKDFEGTKICKRGPLSMTWAQAVHLDLNASLDFWTDTPSNDPVDRLTSLIKASKRVKSFEPDGISETTVLKERRPEGDDSSYCMVVDDGSPDNRDSLDGLKKAFRPGRGGLPDEGSPHLAVAGLMKFFAADIREIDFRKNATIDFRKSLVTGLSAISDAAAREWVQDRAAEAVAAAAVLPCIRATENGGDEEFPAKLVENGYSRINCIILKYVVQNGDVEAE